MGRRNMGDLKTFARFVAMAALLLWCVASAGAMQQQPKPASTPHKASTQPQQHKPAASMQKPIVHAKTVRPVRRMSHPLAGDHAVKKAAVAHKPEKRNPMHAALPKQPQAPKPTAAAPAALSPIALADQTPVLAESSHGRDPFAALIRASDPNAAHANLPPGIAGLQVATLRLEGMVKTPDGMVAVVSNPQDSVYFLHDGDHIYDGVVEKIGIDDVMFRQQSKDAFGRSIDRDVAKRLYPIAGDEQ